MALTHAVMFTLHDPADVHGALERLRGMAGRIPALQAIRAGSNTKEGPHILLLTEHADVEGLQEYAGHPVHVEVLEWLRPRIAARVVVDSADLA